MKFFKTNLAVTIKHISLLIGLLCCVLLTFSQINDSKILTGPGLTNENSSACSLEESLTKLYSKFPEKKQEAIKNNLKLLMKVDSVIDYKSRFPRRDPKLVIPVIFHYFYEECIVTEDGLTEEADLLTYDRFEKAIERVNNDFKGLTSDSCEAPVCGISNISFKLAEIDPNGYPTNGVNRIKSGLTNQGLANYKTLKEVAQWPRNQYINIYIVEKATQSNNSGLAHYPTTSHNDKGKTGNELYDGPTIASWALNPNPDGSRANYDYILSHEIGHWLGLRHIWGDPNDSNYDSCRCSMDDFDFYAELVEEYDTLFEGGTLPALNDINDTPNTIGFSIREETCDTIINSCNDEGEILLECGSANGTINDHLHNIMDYTPCAEAFTPGQILFMEAVLRSDIAERNQLISSSNNAFYANSSEARFVFNEGNTFYENYANDGSFKNSLKIKLQGLVDSTEIKFNAVFTNQLSDTVSKVEIPANYYSLNNLPDGLEVKVFVTGDIEAEIRLIGTTNLNNDLTATFSLTQKNNPLNVTILNQQNFTNQVNFDVIEEAGIVYHNLNPIKSIGPNSNYYNYILIDALEDINKYYYLAYLKDENGDEKFAIGVKESAKEGIELAMNSDGTIKIFLKDELIDAPKYEYDHIASNENTTAIINNIGNIYFRALNFNSENFYVAFKIRTCDVPYYGWLRFKYDNDCSSLKATDYAVQNSSDTLTIGELEEPIIAFHTPVIRKINNNEPYEGFTIELLNAPNSVLTFNENISDYFALSSVESGDLAISENDIEMILLDNTTALVKPANTIFWQKNEEFQFTMDALSGAVLGASQHFLQPTNIVEVLLSNEESEFKQIDKTLQPVNQLWEGFRIYGGELGLQYYSNSINSGYNVYAGGGQRFEFACKPNSNEIDLLDFGNIVNDNLEYRKAKSGATTNDFLLKEGELYIPGDVAQTLAGQTKYLAFRLALNCEIFYGYIEVVFNSSGATSINNYYLNLVNAEEISIGVREPSIPEPENCMECVPKIKNIGKGQDFVYINNFYINEILQPLKNNVTLNDNHYSNYSTPYNNYRIASAYSTLNLLDNLMHNFKIELEGSIIDKGLDYRNKADAAVWFDFNQNNCFESNEKIYSETDNPSGKGNLEFSYNFPPHLQGNYKMRIYAGYYGAGETGCDEVTYGEFEDHSVHLIGACLDEFEISNETYIPSGSYKAKEVIVNPGSMSILFKGENLKLIASTSISIYSNTEIQKGSNFFATIEDCENDNMKKTNNNTDNFSFKIFPNPIKKTHNVQYALKSNEKVDLFVSDNSGKIVLNIVNGVPQVAGSYQVIFNTKELSQGIYYCTLIVGEKVEAQKFAITK